MKTTILLMALLMVGFALAEPTAPPIVTEVGSEKRDLTAQAAQSIEAQGGNVTAVNIDMLSITRSWQGYSGNITGDITLDDASNNTFYNWTIVTTSGEVYGTRTDTVTWVDVECMNSSLRNAEETYLGHSSVDGDSVTNTFNTTDHPEFLVGSTTISTDSCYSTNAFSNGALDTNRFHQILLTDTTNTIYTTLIDSDQTSYDGSQADFQLLVGEDEHDGQEGPTTYYIWVELG